MGLATILFGAFKGPTIDGIQVDVSITEAHELTAEVTDHAVEVGSDISDHKRRMPATYDIEGYVSDTPANLIDFIALQTSGDSAIDRYWDLVDLFESNVVFEVVTGMRVYESMVFTSFRVDRDASTGSGLRFQARMKQVRFAFTEVVPIADDKGAKNTDLGPKKNTPAPEGAANEMQSTLSRYGTPVGKALIRALGGG